MKPQESLGHSGSTSHFGSANSISAKSDAQQCQPIIATSHSPRAYFPAEVVIVWARSRLKAAKENMARSPRFRLLQREHALTRDPAALAIASRWKKRAKQAKRTEENSWLRSRKDRLRVLKTLGEADKILDELRPYLASDWTLPIVQVRQGVGKHETWQRVKISEVLGGGILLRVADWVKRRKSPVARGRPQKVYVLNCALDLASYFYQKTNRCHWRAVGEIVQKYFRASGSLDPEARVRQLVKGWAARYRRDYDAALQEKAEQEELDGAENHGRRPKQSLLRNRTVLNWRPRLDPMPPAKQKVIEMLTNRPAPEPLPAYLLPYFERL